MTKNSINLLQPELLPEKQVLTLSRVAIILAISLVVMLSWSALVKVQHQSLSVKVNDLTQENNIQSELVSNLENELAQRKVDGLLTEKLDRLKLVMKHKEALHRELTDPSRTFVAGFATAMDELSALHYKDIRLQHIKINHDDMSFTGLAKVPEAVPAWLAGFENSTLLSGKSFVHFKLSQNEQGLTEFVVSSVAKQGSFDE